MAKKDYTNKAAQNVKSFKEEKIAPENIQKEEQYQPDNTLEPELDDNQTNENYDELTRKTYYVTPVHVEAIRIMNYKTRKDISELVREMLDKSIPKDIMQEAKENLEELRTRNRQ